MGGVSAAESRSAPSSYLAPAIVQAPVAEESKAAPATVDGLDHSNISMPASGAFDAAYWNKMQALSGKPMGQATTIDYLRKGADAYNGRLASIAAAKSSIMLSVYAIESDPYAFKLLDLLAARAREPNGPAVCVKVDSFPERFVAGEQGAAAENILWQKLKAIRDAGGIVVEYAGTKIEQDAKLGGGDHMKALVCDGGTVIAGGRNLSKDYFTTWNDFDCRLTGTAGVQLAQHVLKNVGRADLGLFGALQGNELTAAQHKFAGIYGRIQADIQKAGRDNKKRLENGGDVGTPMCIMAWDPVHDKRKVPAGEVSNTISQALIETFKRAQKEIVVSCNYINATPELLAVLCDRAKHGVKVHVITTGEECEMHSKMPYRNAVRLYPQLLAAGVQLWEARHVEHGKMLVVDDAVAAYGSYNLELAADGTLVEGMYFSTDPDYIRHIKDNLIETITGRCKPYTPPHRSWLESIGVWLQSLVAGIFKEFI